MEALCAEWQRILCLQDWHVQLKPANPFDMGRGSRSAEVQMELATRHAIVSVLPAEQVGTDMLAPHDQEQALVHELLHLHFEPFAVSSHKPKGMAQEQAINAIADALVALKRASSSGADGQQSSSDASGVVTSSGFKGPIPW